jgi:ribose/xylose/arabinose/galactoside ABC-type transport system permease subunit
VPELGKLLVTLGVLLVVVGALLWSGAGSWMGKLPGDIRIERNGSGFYFPIVTCIVISIVVSLLFSLFRR